MVLRSVGGKASRNNFLRHRVAQAMIAGGALSNSKAVRSVAHETDDDVAKVRDLSYLSLEKETEIQLKPIACHLEHRHSIITLLYPVRCKCACTCVL